MSNDLTNNKMHGQNNSVTEHASEVFEKSSVCAVSTILSNDNKPRKIFWSVLFLLFTFLFFYQCIAFICYVLKYPAVVDLEMIREERFLGPAYTYCNANPIKRSKFCAKYPNNCTKPDRKFCDENPRFCGTPDTLILKEDELDFDSPEEMFRLSHEAEAMADFGMVDEEERPEGPLPRVNQNEMRRFIGSCFTFNDRVRSHLDPRLKRRNHLGHGMGERIVFDPEENELMYPEAETGIMFQIHSPFELVNPFETGYFMKPGYLYRIRVKMTTEELLPSECFNYTEMWLENNKSGFRSKAACKQKCLGDMVVRCMNCSEPFILYPYPNETICDRYLDNAELPGICKNPKEFVKECFKQCKDECVKTKFSYEVHESYQSHYVRQTDRNESRGIEVRIEFPDTDMQKIIHKPQFQVLEIFSLIGGFLAFWIGLSMFQVVEVFDSTFQIVKCLINKRSAGSESSVA